VFRCNDPAWLVAFYVGSYFHERLSSSLNFLINNASSFVHFFASFLDLGDFCFGDPLVIVAAVLHQVRTETGSTRLQAEWNRGKFFLVISIKVAKFSTFFQAIEK
jgi:hypothetical protein